LKIRREVEAHFGHGSGGSFMSSVRQRIVYPEARGFLWLEREPSAKRARTFASRDQAVAAARRALGNQGGGILKILDRSGALVEEVAIPALKSAAGDVS
jgi:hypothetical protein